MFEYDEEYEVYAPMPEELEQIMSCAIDFVKSKQESLIQDNERLKNEIHNMIESVKSMKKENSALKIDLSLADEQKTEKQLLKYLSKKAKSPVNLGDTIWRVESRHEYKECELCNGRKKFTVDLNGVNSEVKCPKCNGAGQLSSYIYSPKKYKVVGFSVKADSYESDNFKTEYSLNGWIAVYSSGSKDVKQIKSESYNKSDHLGFYLSEKDCFELNTSLKKQSESKP